MRHGAAIFARRDAAKPGGGAGVGEEIGAYLAARPDTSGLDVYLGPHCDDICFSLGAHAHRRHTGLLLTVFPVGGYVTAAGTTVEEITRIRLAEEAAFARACGLTHCFLAVEGASVLGHDPFDLGWLAANTQRIEAKLIDALLGLAACRPPGGRPWLFCPGGIGGHVDHAAVRTAILRNAGRLAPSYRLGFYEDLHYASAEAARLSGLDDLSRAASEPGLRRYSLPLGDSIDTKLALIRLYPSQFAEPPESIALFTPFAEPETAPHEAVWSAEPSGAAEFLPGSGAPL